MRIRYGGVDYNTFIEFWSAFKERESEQVFKESVAIVKMLEGKRQSISSATPVHCSVDIKGKDNENA